METELERPDAPARRQVPLVPLLVAALVLALSLAAVFAALWLTAEDVDTEAASARQVGEYMSARQADVTARATDVASLLLNYDSTNIEDVSDQILAMATGGFRDDYEDIVGSGNLQRALERLSSSSRGQILDGPDVSFRSPSEAIAIVTVSQTAQSESNPAGTNVDYVMQLTLLQTNEGWKADDVKILSEQRS
jgi:hypothetical protein